MLLDDAPAIPKAGTSVALWKNAFRALQALGIADTLRQQHPLQIDTYVTFPYVWITSTHNSTFS